MKTDIFKHRIPQIFISITLGLLILNFCLVYFNVAKLEAPLVIRFGSGEASSMLGDAGDLWWIFFMGAFIVVLNTALGAAFFYRERILFYVFAGSSILISLLGLIVIGITISAN